MGLYDTYGIYGIRNKINGMTYVGKTEGSFGDRRDCHYASLNGGYGVNRYLQNAWDKYGEDNFEFIVIHECGPDLSSEDINELERKYIREYKNKGLAYNFGDGGDGGELLGTHLSEETKRKIGDRNRVNMTGRKASEATKKKMSESQRKRFDKMTDSEREEYGRKMSEVASGYKWSDESRERLSREQSTKPRGAKYDVDTVRLIRGLHEKDGLGYTGISQKLNIPRPAVYLIATYRRWKNV